jgi:hypothetical protein
MELTCPQCRDRWTPIKVGEAGPVCPHCGSRYTGNPKGPEERPKPQPVEPTAHIETASPPPEVLPPEVKPLPAPQPTPLPPDPILDAIVRKSKRNDPTNRHIFIGICLGAMFLIALFPYRSIVPMYLAVLVGLIVLFFRFGRKNDQESDDYSEDPDLRRKSKSSPHFARILILLLILLLLSPLLVVGYVLVVCSMK